MTFSKKPEEERSYRLIYFVITLLALGVTLWAFWDETHTRRLWKEYQREFYDLTRQRLQKELKEAQAEFQSPSVQKTYEEILQKLRETQRQVDQNPDYRKAQERLRKIEFELEEARQHFQFAKALADEAFYEWKEEVRQKGGDSTPKKARWEKLDQQAKELLPAMNLLTQKRDDALAEIGKYTGSAEELKRQEVALRKNIDHLREKIDALQESFLLPSASSPELLQVVLPQLGPMDRFSGKPLDLVERCISCHLAIGTEGFEEEAQPFATHPRRKLLLGNHPYEKFGCSPCHQGQGFATTEEAAHADHEFVRLEPDSSLFTKALRRLRHGNIEFWPEPMLREEDIQANCQRCHAESSELEGAPLLAKGKRLFEELQCYGCHEVEGYKDMPKRGPNLKRISSKVSQEWLIAWIQHPSAYQPITSMPNFLLSQQDAEAISAYLWNASEELLKGERAAQEAIKGKEEKEEKKEDTWGDDWWAEEEKEKKEEVEEEAISLQEGSRDEGKKIAEGVGCLGCHNIENTLRNRPYKYERGFALELNQMGQKANFEWLFSWLKDPKSYWSGGFMPSLRLSDEEARDAATYLASLGQRLPEDFQLRERLKKPELREEGKRLIRELGCFGCHEIDGMEGLSKVSVELTTFGDKSVEDLAFGDLTDLEESWEAWTRVKLQRPRAFATEQIVQKMPDYSFKDDEVGALMVFLRSLRDNKPPEIYQHHLSERDSLIERGKRLMVKYNCFGCHQLNQEGGIIRAYYDEKALAPPPLDGEGARVQPNWLFGFLTKPTALRPWLKVRMPTVGFTDEEVTLLVDFFSALEEAKGPYLFVEKPILEEGYRKDAEFLFNIFKCVQCHKGKIEKELVAADLAPDLNLAKKRLRPEWIENYILDPQKLMPGTRMPTYFPEGKTPYWDILDGNTQKQIEALRDYLLLFESIGQDGKG